MYLNLSTTLSVLQEANKTFFPEPDLQVQIDPISYACNLKGAHKIILDYLAPFWMNYRLCFPNQETIVSKTNIPLRTVQRVLNDFAAHGILKKKQRGYNRSNIYMPTKVFMARESIRKLKEIYKWAQLFWFRLLLFVFLDPEKLHYIEAKEKSGVLRNSIKELSIKSYRINRISIVEVIREKTMIDDTTKKTGKMMNEEKKAVFEALKKRGLDFNDAAMAELTMFSDASLLTAGARFVIAAKKSSIANPWAYYVTIAKQVSDEGGISLDRVYASQIRTKMNIQDRDKRILEYTPMMSDNNREDSKKRESGSGVVTQSTPDSDGWVYGVMPDGTKVRSRGYQNDFRKHARDPVDLPLVEKNDTKRSYGNPGETPQTIRMNMMNYVKSQAYTDNCQRDGKEYTDSQITLWMNVANLEEAGNFEKAEQIRAELYGNVMPKIVRI